MPALVFSINIYQDHSVRVADDHLNTFQELPVIVCNNSYLFTGAGNYTSVGNWSNNVIFQGYPGLVIDEFNCVIIEALASCNIPIGETLVNNGTIISDGEIHNNGTIKGNGTHIGNFTNSSPGTFEPGESSGVFTIDGDFENKGVLRVEIGGTTVGTLYDSLSVTGKIHIGGELKVVLINGFMPTGNHQFDIVGFDSLTPLTKFKKVTLPTTPGVDWKITISPKKITLNASSLLPVELTRFDASAAANGGVDLLWTTESELNNEGFELQHSLDAKNWHQLTFVRGQGTTLQSHEYAYHHATPAAGINYYRLHQVDWDGGSSFSQIVNISVNGAVAPPFTVFPNPVSGESFVVNLPEQDLPVSAVLNVYNVAGKLIHSQKADSYQVEMQSANWQPGMYLLEVTDKSVRHVERIVIQ